MANILICFVGATLFRALLGRWTGGYALVLAANVLSALFLAGPIIASLAHRPGADPAYTLGYGGAQVLTAQVIVLAAGLVRLSGRRRRSAAERAAADTGFLRNHWRGERSLFVSVFGSGAQGLLLLAVLFFSVSYEAGQSPSGASIDAFVMASVLSTALFAFAIWFTVGIVRAARKSASAARSAGRPPVGAGAALAAAALVVVVVVGFLGRGLVPGVIDSGRIAYLDDPDLPPYFVRVVRGGSEIEIHGGFKDGLASDLAAAVARNPNVKVVHLTSGGGRIGEAGLVARVIAANKLDTYVPGECDSACTIAFAAGRRRWVLDGAKLGFHAGRGIWGDLVSLPTGDLVTGFQRAYAQAGFAPTFVARAMATPNSEIWKPTLVELREAGVVTDVSDGSQFAMSGMTASPDWMAFTRGAAENSPLLAALRDNEPDAFRKVADVYADSYRRMVSLREANADVQKVLGVIVDARQAIANDAMMVDLAGLLADEYEALGRKDPAACVRYAFDGSAIADRAGLPQEVLGKRMDWEARLVTEKPASTGSASDPAAWKVVFSNLERKLGAGKAALISSKARKPENNAEACEAATVMFREIAALGPDRAGPLMRGVMKNP